MRYLLLLASIIAGSIGMFGYFVIEASIHEVTIVLFLLMAAVLFSSFTICEYVDRLTRTMNRLRKSKAS